MKERPIIFSGESVRAIIAGTKTMTRRIMKPQPVDGEWQVHSGFRVPIESADDYGPFQPGMRLWVKETWCPLLAVSPATDEPIPIENGDRLIEPPTKRSDGRWNYDGEIIVYHATTEVGFCDGDGFMGDSANRDDMPKWKSPRFMPRAASRLTLEVVGVRVERVQDINTNDIELEGISPDTDGLFQYTWDRINGNGSWASNPWVWVVSFQKLEAIR